MICFSEEAAPTVDDSHRFAVSVTCKVTWWSWSSAGAANA
jgi:hypothetical protein